MTYRAYLPSLLAFLLVPACAPVVPGLDGESASDRDDAATGMPKISCASGFGTWVATETWSSEHEEGTVPTDLLYTGRFGREVQPGLAPPGRSGGLGEARDLGVREVTLFALGRGDERHGPPRDRAGLGWPPEREGVHCLVERCVFDCQASLAHVEARARTRHPSGIRGAPLEGVVRREAVAEHVL